MDPMTTLSPAAAIPTTVLPATLVTVPATAHYDFDTRCFVEKPGYRHVDLHVENTLVGMAVERDGRSCLVSLGFTQQEKDERLQRLSGWVADFAAAGLLESRLPWREYAVAQILLNEAFAWRELNRARAPRFAASLEHAKTGQIITPSRSGPWCPGRIQQFLDVHSDMVVWNRDEQRWSR